MGPLAGVWNDALQRPVKISQVFATPFESVEIAIPSFACRLINLIGAKVGCMEVGLVVAGFVDEDLICQNLTDSSLDIEMREEENAMEITDSVWPTKVFVIVLCSL